MTTEVLIRIGCFVGVLSLMILWEFAAPKRRLSHARSLRWSNNMGLVVLNTLVVRLIVPIMPTALAVLCIDRGWGALNMVAFPGWLELIIAVLVLDLIIYLQHVMVHVVPIFWRLHRMHHADLDYDVTTALRFHPLEILLSLAIKLGAVVILGPSVEAVIAFEVILNATAMFNHGNVKLPLGLDRILRLLVVTPDMHRVHHSIRGEETNSNYGFNFPWWDRMFGTYRAQPADGQEEMTIGLPILREPEELRIDRLITQPFR